jgi:hypothetical protein
MSPATPPGARLKGLLVEAAGFILTLSMAVILSNIGWWLMGSAQP